MKRKIIITTFISVIAILGALNIYNNEYKKQFSDLVLENIDALAFSESSEDFTASTGCYATICNKQCKKGNTIHTYASSQKCTCSLCN